MTGYGKGEAILPTGKLTIEIRKLNGKNAEINLKTSLIPKDKEIGIRKKIAEKLQRGTIDIFVGWEANAAECAKKINKDLALEYYKDITGLGKELGIMSLWADNPNLLLANILRMPEVVDSKKADIITDENWPLVEAAFTEAMDMVCEFREKEGSALYEDVTGRVKNILEMENEVESFEGERIQAVKDKILKALEDLSQKPDQSRFEQELVFYLEKLDINEEKVRLRQHCQYYLDTIANEENPGKKLGFIIQEMGREINTTGSKANHVGIQKVVVRMKDELEKIREQSRNIL